MPYNYEAASTSQSSRARSARPATSTGSASRINPSSGPSVAITTEEEAGYSTRDRWAAAQSPAVHTGRRARSKVRFADQTDPALLHPHGRQHRPDSPLSQASSVPSLSHSADMEHDDDLKCPPTPEVKPRELEPEPKSRKSSRSSKSKASMSPAHAAAYSTIDQIFHEFNTLVVAFQHPPELDFVAPVPGSNAVPALAYTAKNRPYLEHIQYLEALQNELDGVSSHNDDGIRKARKAAVIAIEHELDGLKRVQARIWSKVLRQLYSTIT
ncbi:hypothetical protein RhiLY_00390 [Ceratobasidium sp. AG-Ba]|nr:hypothetical protein RhiLY_00390 [Ceratobasidium sp. AG-Ba]